MILHMTYTTQDVHCTRALLGEVVAMALDKPLGITLGFVGDVQEAMSLEDLDAIPMQCKFDGVNNINTYVMFLIQLNSELQNTPMRFVSCPTLLSPQEFLCTLHSSNPCNATPLIKGLKK